MNRKQAESIIQKFHGCGSVTIQHANQWPGSRDYCHRSGLNPAKAWATSIYVPGRGIYEPTAAYRTIDDLVTAHCE